MNLICNILMYISFCISIYAFIFFIIIEKKQRKMNKKLKQFIKNINDDLELMKGEKNDGL